VLLLLVLHLCHVGRATARPIAFFRRARLAVSLPQPVLIGALRIEKRRHALVLLARVLQRRRHRCRAVCSLPLQLHHLRGVPRDLGKHLRRGLKLARGKELAHDGVTLDECLTAVCWMENKPVDGVNLQAIHVGRWQVDRLVQRVGTTLHQRCRDGVWCLPDDFHHAFGDTWHRQASQLCQYKAPPLFLLVTDSP